MIFASSNLLGIAVTDRAIVCVELSGRGAKASTRKAATFVLAPDMTLDKPDAVGTALGEFLKKQGFTADKAVVGVPAKWVIAVEKDIPPSSSDQARAMLRLQAERLPLADNGELVFDFAGEQNPGKAGKVLLVAMLRKQYTRIEQFITAAGLRLEAVTPTVLALSAAAASRAGGKKSAPLLMLNRTAAEVVWQRGNAPQMMRHVSVTIPNGHGPAIGPLGTELRRAVAMSGNGSDGVNEMTLLDGIGLAQPEIDELSERVGVKVRISDGMSMLGVQSPPRPSSTESPGHYAPALALALAGTDRAMMPLNFADSRLAPPPERRFGNKTIIAAILGVALLVYISILMIDNSRVERELNQVKADRAELKQKVTDATTLRNRVEYANGFFGERRTPMLDCLLEITQIYQVEDPFWAVNFQMNEDRDAKDMGMITGRVEGRTTNFDSTIQLADRMRKNPNFSSVKGPEVIGNTASGGRGGRGGESQSTFSINFTYNAKPAAAPEKTNP